MAVFGTSTMANCSACKSPGCDLQLSCGCNLHVICLPLSLVLDGTQPDHGGGLPLGPRRDACVPCLTCAGTVQRIQLFPLAFEALKKSIELRVAEAASSGRNVYNSSPTASESLCGNKRDRECSKDLLEVEAAYAVFDQGKYGASRSGGDSDSLRTGRWMDAEVEYVDFLIKAFDKGQLPLAHGTKLSTFLCDALLCKPSRLTKKMKNANLSKRNFELQPATLQSNADFHQAKALKALQDRFVNSMPSEYSRLECEFNLSMHWRACFSDLCVQVGYGNLDGSRFIASVEEYERLGSNAEEGLRNVRRRRMMGSFSGPGDGTPSNSISALAQLSSAKTTFDSSSGPHNTDIEDELIDETGMPFMDSFIDHEDNDLMTGENFHDSLAGIFDEGEEVQAESAASRRVRRDSVSREPFLEVIANYLEELDLPFQHADVWAPSFADEDSDDEIRLLHAGDVTRGDLEGQLRSAFESFGAYSKNFSFAPGKGLVGRVYSSGKTMWEFGLNKLDPNFFLRAGGAEEYGVRTAVGIPFPISGVGRMVVVLYSCNHIPEDSLLAFQFARELAQYAPCPKWKLVVEMSGDSPSENGEVQSSGERRLSMDEQLPPPADKEGFSRSAQSGLVSPLGTPRSHYDYEGGVNEIVALIGEQLAIQGSSAAGDPIVFQQLMRIRLMLLRPSNRRSLDENDKIDILLNSYRSYSAGSRRSGKELAILLAKEWLCMSEGPNAGAPQGTAEGAKTFSQDDMLQEPKLYAPTSSDTYTSHAFAPALEPLTSNEVSKITGSVMMPPPLQLSSHPGKVTLDFTSRGDSMVVIDHSIRDSMPMTPGKFVHSTSFPQTMTRTVSCSTVPSGPSHQPFDTMAMFRTNSFVASQPQMSIFDLD